MNVMPPVSPIAGAAVTATALASLLQQQNPTIPETFLSLFWELHVLGKPKGNQPPTAVFNLGPLSDVALERLEAKHPAWENVENTLHLPADVITHWDDKRRYDLYPLLRDLGDHVREAEDVAPGSTDPKWLNPLLLTRAPSGLILPIAIALSDSGIIIRSMITPVSAHKLAVLRKRYGEE